VVGDGQLPRGCGVRPLGLDHPPGDQPVAAITGIDRIGHDAVEVRVVVADVDTESVDVEVSVAPHQWIEGPRHHRDALLDGPRALVLLDGGPDSAIAHAFDHRRHVAVQIDTTGERRIACGEAERRADDAIAFVVHDDTAVGACMHESAQQVRRDLGSLPGPYLIEDRARGSEGVGLIRHLDAHAHDGHRTQGVAPGWMRHHGPVTSALLASARARQDDLVGAVRTLVEVESPSADVEACRACVATAAGLVEAWLPGPGRIEEHQGRPVLRWGPDRPRVLLLGHLDTVWPLGTLERLPWTVDGDRMRGPGVFDMKTGVVEAIGALALLELDDASGVGMLLTTDEEIGSGCSRAVIEDAARDAEAVLVLEPSVEGELKTARKGTSWYVVQITGRAAHAGLDPERGINALVEAAALVSDAVTWARPELGTTVTPTTARAGVTDNTVPDQAVIGIDVRAWSAEEQQRVDDLARGWRPAHPDAGVAIVGGGINRPAMEESSGAPLARLAEQCAADMGLAPIGSRSVGGASDGNFTAAMGIPTLDGLGAVGDGAHAEHEWASVSALPERTALVAALIAAILARETV